MSFPSSLLEWWFPISVKYHHLDRIRHRWLLSGPGPRLGIKISYLCIRPSSNIPTLPSLVSPAKQFSLILGPTFASPRRPRPLGTMNVRFLCNQPMEIYGAELGFSVSMLECWPLLLHTHPTVHIWEYCFSIKFTAPDYWFSRFSLTIWPGTPSSQRRSAQKKPLKDVAHRWNRSLIHQRFISEAASKTSSPTHRRRTEPCCLQLVLFSARVPQYLQNRITSEVVHFICDWNFKF